MPGLNGPLLSYKAFMDMQENPISMSDAEKHYSKYKDAYERKQWEIFYQIHKDEHWFREKYDPQLQFKFKNDQMKQSQTLARRFMEALERNEFDQICLEFQENFENAKQNEKEISFEKKGAQDDEDISGSPYFGFDANKTTLYLKLIPIHISRWDLLDAVKPTPGFLGLSMSEPLKTQDFVRYAWVTYDSDENCQRSKTILEKVSLKDFDLNPVISISTTRKKVKVTPLLNKGCINRDKQLSKSLIEIFDKQRQIEDNRIFENESERNERLQLDLQLLYLRRVHAFCFYCCEK